MTYAEKTKSITTARKSILKLLKLQRLVAKCCKMRKIYSPANFANFVYFLYYVQKFARLGVTSAAKNCECMCSYCKGSFSLIATFIQSQYLKALAASLRVGFCDEWKRGLKHKITKKWNTFHEILS